MSILQVADLLYCMQNASKTKHKSFYYESFTLLWRTRAVSSVPLLCAVREHCTLKSHHPHRHTKQLQHHKHSQSSRSIMVAARKWNRRKLVRALVCTHVSPLPIVLRICLRTFLSVCFSFLISFVWCWKTFEFLAQMWHLLKWKRTSSCDLRRYDVA